MHKNFSIKIGQIIQLFSVTYICISNAQYCEFSARRNLRVRNSRVLSILGYNAHTQPVKPFSYERHKIRRNRTSCMASLKSHFSNAIQPLSSYNKASFRLQDFYFGSRKEALLMFEGVINAAKTNKERFRNL